MTKYLAAASRLNLCPAARCMSSDMVVRRSCEGCAAVVGTVWRSMQKSVKGFIVHAYSASPSDDGVRGENRTAAKIEFKMFVDSIEFQSQAFESISEASSVKLFLKNIIPSGSCQRKCFNFYQLRWNATTCQHIEHRCNYHSWPLLFVHRYLCPLTVLLPGLGEASEKNKFKSSTRARERIYL